MQSKVVISNHFRKRNGGYLEATLESIEKKKVALLLLFPLAFLYIMFKNSLSVKTSTELVFNSTSTGLSIASSINTYLVFSTKCKIPSIDPYNKEVASFIKNESFIPCSTLGHLTYVTKNENNTEAYIHINGSMLRAYTNDDIICYVNTVDRNPTHGSGADNGIIIRHYTSFINNATLPKKPVLVICKNRITQAAVYSNTYDPIILQPRIQEKMENVQHLKKPYSVLIFGIDSTSRLEMIRSLPGTRKFLQETGWLEAQGYNKVGENTLPNLMPLLTGRNVSDAFANCNPYIPGGLDRCNYLWKDYARSNYITLYAEGSISFSTFNYAKEGFQTDPTDYYFRKYFLASGLFLKTLDIDNTMYCLGPTGEPARLFSLIEEFSTVFKNAPSFSLFWTNYGHNQLNAGTRFDLKIKQTLQALRSEGILNDTIVLFLSDHGLRIGKYAYTYSGRLESRLPFFYLWIPDGFKLAFPDKYSYLSSNLKKLITPYDVYMTLQEVLRLVDANYTVEASRGCKKCTSLFSEIPMERSCEDAGIPAHFCTCNSFEPISVNNQTVQDSAQFLLKYVAEIFDGYSIAKKCARYKLNFVRSSRLYVSSMEESYVLIVVETIPSAVLEGTIKVNFTAKGDDRFECSRDISRLDFYGPHSHCVGDSYLKTLCYCQI